MSEVIANRPTASIARKVRCLRVAPLGWRSNRPSASKPTNVFGPAQRMLSVYATIPTSTWRPARPRLLRSDRGGGHDRAATAGRRIPDSTLVDRPVCPRNAAATHLAIEIGFERGQRRQADQLWPTRGPFGNIPSVGDPSSERFFDRVAAWSSASASSSPKVVTCGNDRT